MTNKIEYINNKIKWFEKQNPKKFHSEIKRQLFEIYSPLLNNIDKSRCIQYGGNKELTIEEVYEDLLFKTVIKKTKYDVTVNILSHNKANPADCAIINIDRETKIAYISNINYYDNCMKEVKPGYVKRKSGSILLKYVLNLLKVNKNAFNVKRIALKDNSIKICKNCSDNIRLSDMYFLLYGNTWYGRYGFLPYDIVNDKPDEYYIGKYMTNRKIIKNTLVNDTKFTNNQEIMKFINKYGKLKLSTVLFSLLKKYDKYCCLFIKIQNELYNELGLQSFFGFSFYLDI